MIEVNQNENIDFYNFFTFCYFLQLVSIDYTIHSFIQLKNYTCGFYFIFFVYNKMCIKEDVL